MGEWRLATGLINVDTACLPPYYRDGQQDFDTNIWLRIASTPDVESDKLWVIDKIKVWFSNLTSESETFCKHERPVSERIATIILEWSEIRLHIPLIARSAIAEGVFGHVS